MKRPVLSAEVKKNLIMSNTKLFIFLLFTGASVVEPILKSTNLKDKELKVFIDKTMMSALGLSEPPTTMMNRSKSAHNFIKSIYQKTLINEESAVDEFDEFLLTDHHLKTIDRSDRIISFAAQKLPNSTGNLNDEQKIWFNVSAIVNDSSVDFAELRLFKKTMYNSNNRQHYYDNQTYTVIINQCEFAQALSAQKCRIIIDMQTVTSHQHDWIIFNVTKSLKLWLKNPQNNLGFRIAVYVNEQDIEVSPNSIGLVLLSDDYMKHPFMTGFFRKFSRNKRMADDGVAKKSKRANDDEEDSMCCRKKPLKISFHDIGYGDWIIAPSAYDAGYCDGPCKNYFFCQSNIEPHPLFQFLMYESKPETSPEPTCAPSEFKAISIIYADKDKSSVTKWEDMVVESCKCY